MSSLAAIIAATLSLSSPTGYVYSTPATTNLVGIGMGTRPVYVVPRQEDISFLREAYAERENALYGGVRLNPDSPARPFHFWPSKGPAFGGGYFLEDAVGLSFVWWLPNPPQDVWGSVDFPGAFVAPTFEISDQYWFSGVEAEPDYSVNGVSTDLTNGLAFAVSSWSGLLVDPAEIKSNVVFEGALTLATVTNAYADLKLTGAVLGAVETRGNILDETVDYTSGEITTYTNIYSTQTYTDWNGQSRTRSYVSGQALQGTVAAGPWTTTNRPPTSAGISLAASAFKEKTRKVGQLITGWAPAGSGYAPIFENHELDPYVSRSAEMLADWPNGTNRISRQYAILSTNAVCRADLVDSVTLYTVVRYRFDIEDTLQEFDGLAYKNSTTNYTANYWVSMFQLPAEFVATTNGYHVWRSVDDFGVLLEALYTVRGQGRPQIADLPDPECVPVNTNTTISAAVTRRTITKTMVVDDVFLYPLVIRRYNADFTE